jgi:hypothetical protein
MITAITSVLGLDDPNYLTDGGALWHLKGMHNHQLLRRGLSAEYVDACTI